MNWNKVLNVFIAIFIVLNLFLYWYQNQYDKDRFTLTEKRENQLSSIMAEEGVTIYEFIPNYFPMESLVLGEPGIDKENVIRTILGETYDILLDDLNLGEKVTSGDESLIFYFGEQDGYVYYSSEGGHYVPENMTLGQVEKVAKEFAIDLFGEDVQMEITVMTEVTDTEPNGLRIEMNEVYGRDQHKVFQTFIKLFITREGVLEALAVRYPPIELSNEPKNIFAFDVVMYNLVYNLENELEALKEEGQSKTIKDINVGYYLPDVDSKKLTYELEPHYRVVFKDGDTFYINAYTNVITKP